MKSRKSADVVDMRVSADDGANFEAVAADYGQDALDLVARIHHNRFVRLGIAKDRTIALKQPDWNQFVNQLLIRQI